MGCSSVSDAGNYDSGFCPDVWNLGLLRGNIILAFLDLDCSFLKNDYRANLLAKKSMNLNHRTLFIKGVL